MPTTTPKVPVEVPGTPRPRETPRVDVPHTVEPGVPATTPTVTPKVVVEVPSSVAPSSVTPSVDPFAAPISSRPPSSSLFGSSNVAPPSAKVPPYKPDAIIPVETPKGTVSGWQRAPDGSRRWQTNIGELSAEGTPFARGGFADAHKLVEANGDPSGFVSKFYSPESGKYGKNGPKYDPNNPLTAADQRKLVEDTVYGSSRLKDADILQAEIVGHGITKEGGYVLQREVGKNLPDGVKGEEILSKRLKNGELTLPEKEALSDLFQKLDDAGLGWEDPNTGNIFLREHADGTFEAGILDQDRIGLWAELDPKRDRVLIGFKDWYAQDPRNFGITSMPDGGGGIGFNTAREFNNKMRESKGYWRYLPGQGYFGGILDGATVQKHFPDVTDNLPGQWPHWVNPPPAAPPPAPLLRPGVNRRRPRRSRSNGYVRPNARSTLRRAA